MLTLPQPKKLITRRGLMTGAVAGASAAYVGLQPERVRAQSPCGTFYPTPPPGAAFGGFSRLVYADDFNVAGTIGPQSSTTGYNFYLNADFNDTLANATILPTQTAAGVANGNSGGGPAASPLGGILKMNGTGPNNSGNITIRSSSTNYTGNSNPGLIYGGYIEAYMQFNPNLNKPSNWPAWWMNAQQRITFNGTANSYAEIDIMENFLGNFSFPTSQTGGNTKEWTPSGSVSCGGTFGNVLNGAYTQFNQDSNWHAFGVCWTVNGGLGSGPSTAATGTFSYWLDNQKIYTYNGGNFKTIFNTGPGGDVGARFVNFSYQVLLLGGGYGAGADMNVDYVRVWQ